MNHRNPGLCHQHPLPRKRLHNLSLSNGRGLNAASLSGQRFLNLKPSFQFCKENDYKFCKSGEFLGNFNSSKCKNVVY